MKCVPENGARKGAYKEWLLKELWAVKCSHMRVVVIIDADCVYKGHSTGDLCIFCEMAVNGLVRHQRSRFLRWSRKKANLIRLKSGS